jgi:hypothetical protein
MCATLHANMCVMNVIKEDPTSIFYLEMETEGSAKTFLNLQGRTRRHLPENITLHAHKTFKDRKMQTKGRSNSTGSLRN